MNTTQFAFNELSAEAQEKIKNVLGAYNRCTLEFNVKTFESRASTCVGISSTRSQWIVLGEYHKNDVLTLEERIMAYLNNFGDFSDEYKGVRDWKSLNKWVEEGKPESVKLVDGNIIF